MTKVNKLYEAPTTNVVELKTQGIICASETISAQFNPYVDGEFSWPS